MPKLYEYFGLVLLFYSKEHLPIHVHVEYNEYVSVAELSFEDGKLVKIEWRKKRAKNPLPAPQLKKAEELLQAKAVEIAEKWHDYFVLNKAIKPEKITQKL